MEYSKCLIFKQIFEDIVSKGDYILIETPAYPGVMSLVSWLYINILHILPPVVCGRVHVLFALFGVFLRIVVSNIYCVLFFFDFCIQCCQILWIVLFFIVPSVFSTVFIFISVSLSNVSGELIIYSYLPGNIHFTSVSCSHLK